MVSFKNKGALINFDVERLRVGTYNIKSMQDTSIVQGLNWTQISFKYEGHSTRYVDKSHLGGVPHILKSNWNNFNQRQFLFHS